MADVSQHIFCKMIHAITTYNQIFCQKNMISIQPSRKLCNQHCLLWHKCNCAVFFPREGSFWTIKALQLTKDTLGKLNLSVTALSMTWPQLLHSGNGFLRLRLRPIYVPYCKNAAISWKIHEILTRFGFF